MALITKVKYIKYKYDLKQELIKKYGNKEGMRIYKAVLRYHEHNKNKVIE